MAKNDELKRFVAKCFEAAYHGDRAPFQERAPWNIIFETAQQFPEVTLREFVEAMPR